MATYQKKQASVPADEQRDAVTTRPKKDYTEILQELRALRSAAHKIGKKKATP